jgi:MinD superfamily P-loop ATPase
MKELVVISGKGGTGKTSIVASFAALAENKVMADCDVDAADLHLVLKPTVLEKHEFKSGKTAFIDKELCIECGQCLEVCRFEAISDDFIINKLSCEGCGACVHFCPVDAIEFNENLAGHWFVSDTRYGPMVHAQLGIAEENSGKLVTLVRTKAKNLAEDKNHWLLAADGSPGIGCPVIASITGTDPGFGRNRTYSFRFA